MTSPRVRDALVRWIGLGLGACGFVALAMYLVVSVRAGGIAFDRFRVGPLAASFGCLIAGYAAQASAWHCLRGGRRAAEPWRVDAARWAVSLLGKYIPGKVFHAVGRVVLYRKEGDQAGVTAAFAAEFVLNMSAAVVAALIGLALAPLPLPFPWRALLWIGAALGLAATFTGAPDRVVGWLAGRLLGRPVAAVPEVRARLAALLLSLAGYLLLGTGLLMLSDALAATSWTLWPAYLAAYCLSGLAGVLAFFVPAGLGVRDVALAWLLSFVMTPPLAATVALATRCWLTAGDVLAVGAGFAVTSTTPRRTATGRTPRGVSMHRSIIDRFGFLDDPEGRAARGRRIVALLRDCAGAELTQARVLDIGCGAGLMTREVAGHAKATVGVEIDAEAVTYAAAHLRSDRLAFVRASAERLPFRDGAFDVVLCNHVYEHVDDVGRLVREIARVLRDDGVCWFAAGHTLQWMEPHYRLPLLSMLPLRAASALMRVTGRGNHYDVRYVPPWRVRALLEPLGEAQLVSATALRDPVRYELATGVLRHAAVRRFVKPIARPLAWLAPTHFWLVRKRGGPAPGRNG